VSLNRLGNFMSLQLEQLTSFWNECQDIGNSFWRFEQMEKLQRLLKTQYGGCHQDLHSLNHFSYVKLDR